MTRNQKTNAAENQLLLQDPVNAFQKIINRSHDIHVLFLELAKAERSVSIDYIHRKYRKSIKESLVQPLSRSSVIAILGDLYNESFIQRVKTPELNPSFKYYLDIEQLDMKEAMNLLIRTCPDCAKAGAVFLMEHGDGG